MVLSNLYGTQNVTIRGNVINTKASGMAIGSDGLPVSNVKISDNKIFTELHTAYSALATGIGIDGDSDGVSVIGNTIEQIGTVSSAESAYPERFNLIRVGVASAANPSSVVARYNNLSKINPSNYVYIGPGVTGKVNALRNWWNDDSNPSSKVNSASKVKYEPWLCEAYIGQATPRESVGGTCADTTGPELDVTTPAADGAIRAPGVYTLKGTVSDDISGFDRLKVQIKDLTDDTQVLSPQKVVDFTGDAWTFEVPTGTFVDGHKYTITFNAYDNVNNLTTVRRTVTIDNTAPNGTVATSNNGSPTNGNVVATLVTNEDIATPAGWTLVSGHKFTRVYTDNGSYSVIISDALGNSRTLSFGVTGIDRVAPAAEAGTDSQITGYSVQLLGSSDDPTASATWSASGPGMVTFSSAAALSSTATVAEYGLYVFTLRVVDAAGNESADSVIVTFSAPVVVPLGEDPSVIETSSNEKLAPIANPGVATTSDIVASAIADSDDKGEVLGTDTEKDESPADKNAVLAPSQEGWKLWGVAWYWYLLALGALGVGGWYAVKWYRRREADF